MQEDTAVLLGTGWVGGNTAFGWIVATMPRGRGPGSGRDVRWARLLAMRRTVVLVTQGRLVLSTLGPRCGWSAGKGAASSPSPCDGKTGYRQVHVGISEATNDASMATCLLVSSPRCRRKLVMQQCRVVVN